MTTTTPTANQFPLPAGAVKVEEWALGGPRVLMGYDSSHSLRRSCVWP